VVAGRRRSRSQALGTSWAHEHVILIRSGQLRQHQSDETSSHFDPFGGPARSIPIEMTSRESTQALDVDLANGDAGVLADVALDAFVVEHYDRLIRLARLICSDGPDAADAVQVALEQAWRRRSSLRQDGSLRPWIDRIVVREAIRIGHSRTSRLGRLFSTGSGVTWIEPADPSSESLPAWSALRSAFAKLSADQRAVVALHLYAGYSVAETADLVGAPLETVRSRLRLAKDRLRRQLGERES